MVGYLEINGEPLLHKRQSAQLGEHFYSIGEAIKTIDNREEYYQKQLIHEGSE